ncbi:DUF6098 family protein [Microbacterium abyssi]|uniref:DUF6098 family protein n=1 Tax=Microbacterium abyssi TaxID=2782166 RepID=UPI001E3B0537|nr:DUF6098 family protein [Microbacterium sp. A18JL241]
MAPSSFTISEAHEPPLMPLSEVRLLACETLRDVVGLVEQIEPLYVRYSEGPDHDAGGRSLDLESRLELPGLSVNPMTPESWWARPVEDWVARQLCQYQHLADKNPRRFAWLLTGAIAGRGPDCEPLLVDTMAIASVSQRALDEASERYHRAFDAGRGPED